MDHFLDIDSWNRRSHFEFFKDFEQPFFGLCTDVDVSAVYEQSRKGPVSSFFLTCLYLSIKASNEIEPFRFRLRDKGVLVHDRIHGSSTIARDDGTFGFGYFEYQPDFQRFMAAAAGILTRVREESGDLGPRPDRDDLIHYSVIPWVSFSGLLHARRIPSDDSIPKIVFGKHHLRDGSRRLPISIEAHHALMDGLEVGQFLERFQELLREPPTL
jgi:chloramphenicol O-acetyltransferase type A